MVFGRGERGEGRGERGAGAADADVAGEGILWLSYRIISPFTASERYPPEYSSRTFVNNE